MKKSLINVFGSISIGIIALTGCPGDKKPDGINNPIINPQATVDDVKLSFMNIKDAIKKYVKSNEKNLDKILYISPYSSSGSSRIKIFGYESDNDLQNNLANLFYPQKGLHISGEYTDKVYFYNLSRNYDSREEGTITYTTDEKDVIKSVVIKDSSNAEFLKLNYSLIDNPSITGAKSGHTIKGANVDLKFHDSMCNNGTLNGNVILAGEFEQQYNSIRAVSAIQLVLNGKCDTQTMKFTGSAYDFTSSYYDVPMTMPKSSSSYTYPTPSPIYNQKSPYLEGVIYNMPGVVKINMNYPGYILSSVNGDFNYDWKNTKNITGNANFTFNNEYWIASLKMDYDANNSSSSFSFKSISGTLENSTKNYIISVNATPSRNSYGSSDWYWRELNLNGEIRSNGKKLADISIKETRDQGYTAKAPVITYTDGTELNLETYGNELSKATGINSPAPVVGKAIQPSATRTPTPYVTVSPPPAVSTTWYATPPVASPSAWTTPTPARSAYLSAIPTPARSAYLSAIPTPETVPPPVSNIPDVILIDPPYNSSGLAPHVSFKLTFSKDVDKTSVEEGFLIETNTDQTTPFTVGATFGNKGAKVYEKSDYDISWDSYREVTFYSKSGYALPTDKDTNRVPQYRITFKTPTNPFQDIYGISARTIINIGTSNESGPFRVTSTLKGCVPFTVFTDTTAPKVDSISIIDNQTIKVRFTESMTLYPFTATANNKFYNTNLFNPTSYTISISADGINYEPGPAVNFVTSDGNDSTFKTLKLTVASTLSSYSNNQLKVSIPINVISDPAGNYISNIANGSASIVVPTL